MTTSRIVAGVDSSTSATKLQLRDAETGRLLHSSRVAHPPTTPPRSEQDPQSWWEALVSASGQVPRGAAISAWAVAGQQHGMVVLDGSDAVVRPAKLWNDTESAPQALELVERLGGPQAWASACGSVPTASFTVTKLAWLRAHEPDSFLRLAKVLLPHDWLTFRLTGRKVTDRGDASGTGYWSPATQRWRPDLLELVDPEVDWVAALPEVLSPLDAVGTLAGAPASELGASRGAIVAPGTGDNMAAALGLGLAAGDVAVSLGTSGTVFAVSAAPTADPTGLVAGFADAAGAYLPLACTLNATRVTDAMAAWLGVDRGRFEALALSAPPGAGGVVLVPYLDGERTPNRPTATGQLSGLRTTTTQGQLARAAVEGVICGLLDGLDALGCAGVATTGRLLMVGGGARSGAYRRVLADLSQRSVVVPVEEELVALGACVQAAAVLQQRSPLAVSQAWGMEATSLEPDPAVDAGAVRAAYAAARG